MIQMLQGLLVDKSTDGVIIMCGGVGFKVLMPLGDLADTPDEGSEATLFTYLNVKEDGIELYGFSNSDGRETFKTLISVSGIGPKAGLSILSSFTPQQIALSISAGDYKAFTACPGIGPKIAQRLVLELKDKFKVNGSVIDMSRGARTVVSSGAVGDAVAALCALGFSGSEAAAAVGYLPAGLSSEELISAALKQMAKK